MQAAVEAAKAEAEGKVATLIADLSAAQASCADLSSQLQQSQQDYASKIMVLQEEHQAALQALQAQLLDRQQQLDAAATKAQEDSAAIAAANLRMQEQDSQIEELKQQLAGKVNACSHRTCLFCIQHAGPRPRSV